MLADTHCHLDFNKFDEDRDAVIERAREAGVTRILVPALDFESSLATVRLAATHTGIYAAVGFHPTGLDEWSEHSIERLRELMLPHPNPSPAGRGTQGEGKIVAIGEIGLDYYWVKEPEKRSFQHEVLKLQLKLAQEVNKPVIIHMREENDAWFGEASTDLLEILSEWQQGLHSQGHPLAKKPGVLHSYNGNFETAQKAMDLNFLIGITGPVTYKNAQVKRDIVKQIPITKLLIETDAPFLTPVPYRGRRNEPAFIAYIADKIAEVHMTNLEQVAEVTTNNANQLFGWGG